jgi:hypothetical protein
MFWLRILLIISLLPAVSWAVDGDYTGDEASDLVVASVNRSAGTTTFSIKTLDGTTTDLTVAAAGDALVPADYNGDGVTDPAVVWVRPDARLEWHIKINGTETTTLFGGNGDRPFAADFDGDGSADLAVARLLSGRYFWFMQLSGGSTKSNWRFGSQGDNIFVTDIDGDQKAEIVLARTSGTAMQWITRGIEDSSYVTTEWGAVTDTPLSPMDFDGDGSADFVRVVSSGGSLTAIAKLSDSELSQDLGSSDVVPLTGYFFGSSASFGTYTRATTSSFTAIDGSGNTTVSHGVKASVLVRPDGTVVQPGEMGGTCSSMPIVSIDSLRWVLYKPSNLHGGRGPTFLVQNPTERTGKRRIRILDINCRQIATFGLYRTDHPYGSRYYQKSGGSGYNARKLKSLALRADSTNILVEGKNKWIVVSNPENRQGTIQ